MPQLRVEYSKSARAKCNGTGCSQTFAKHELRIGTGVLFPGAGGGKDAEDGDHLTYKWRHLCCFTERQLQNARSSGDIDNIDGYDELAPADQELVDRMKRGELLNQSDLKGVVGDIANSPLAEKLIPNKPAKRSRTTAITAETATTKKTAKRARTEKIPQQAAAEDVEDKNSSDATEECEVVVEKSKPICPYGDKCFRTGKDHIAEYSHGTDNDKASPSQLRAVIKEKKLQKSGRKV